jgi:glyoxylase-like metal-dependent hydrolase (beta-lactamase superfamily II)
MPHWICTTCAVEYPEAERPPVHCPICEDERQYVPPSGQVWTTLEALAASGHRLDITQTEPGLWGISPTPAVGINQKSHLVQTDAGNLLWDPPGFIDAPGIERVHQLGGVAAIVASHPHMYGTQVSWSQAFDGAPVWIAAADHSWVQRGDPAIRTWTDDFEVLPGITLRQVGGHFPGSAVAFWAAGAGGRGVLLSGDTLFPLPDERWVSFLRSYPNLLPLSPAVVERVASAVLELPFERIYGNFGNAVASDAHGAVRRSADRYIAWVTGQHDDLT